MAAVERAYMAGLSTRIGPDTNRWGEATSKDALVPLWLGLWSSCLAPSDAANHTRPLSPTTERYVGASHSSAAQKRCTSPDLLPI